DEIELYPQGGRGRIRGIQIHGREVEEVEAGHRTAINIQGLDMDAIHRGEVLATPGCLRPSYMLDAEFTYLSSNKKNLKNRARVRVHLGTAEIMGRVVLLEQEEGAPGDVLNVQILLEEAAAVWPGDRYVVRSYSPVFTIGGGTILNPCVSRKRRRFRDENPQIFQAYRAAADELAIFHLNESGINGLTYNDLQILTGVFGKRLSKVLRQPLSQRRILLVDSERQWYVGARIMTVLENNAIEIIKQFHQDNPLKEGVGKEELRSRLQQGLEPKLFQLLLNNLTKAGNIEQEQSLVRLSGHEVAMAADVSGIQREIEEMFRVAKLNPPTTKEVMAHFKGQPEKLLREIIETLIRDDRLQRISGNLYFHRQCLTDLEERLRAVLERDGEIDAQGFKGLTGLSRKFSIPLLEYFDRRKLTIRVGDKRVLR
ncbi:Selenocysteine-specific translation elongation factor, partial [hydrothermal vent metagenome]